jgi:hypothetical protein
VCHTLKVLQSKLNDAVALLLLEIRDHSHL